MSTVTGPTSSTNTAVARWNGTTGAVIQDSTVTIDGSGNVAGVASLAGSVTTTTQSQGDNSTNIATTAYVDTGLAGLSLDSLSDVTTDYSMESMFLGDAGTGGDHNTSLGYQAFHDRTNLCSWNTVMGAGAGLGMSNSSFNVAIGGNAMGSGAGDDNVGIGYRALYANGDQNIGIGSNALEGVNSDGNIGIGFNAGISVVSGNDNILIGRNVDVPTTSTANYIAIGDAIVGDHMAVNIAGSPTTTTQSPGDNSTKIATTAYVDAAVAASGGKAATFQYLTSGSSATYTTPAGCQAILVEAWGGGGGGAAQVTNAGGAGGDTIFNSVHAKGGNGGGLGGGSGAPGLGGAGTTSGTGTATYRGGPGQPGFESPNTANNTKGGNGGATSLGGAAAGVAASAGNSAVANTGSGGAGGAAGANGGGGGGQAGEYFQLYIASPASTYTYTIGSSGTGGAAGTKAGGNGGSGLIRVTEYY